MLAVADLAYQAAGSQPASSDNRGDGPARAVLLGGAPFGEQLVMWWNFVGRSHDDIAVYREQWQNHDARFGAVDGIPRPGVTAARAAPAQRHPAAPAQPRGVTGYR